MRRQVSPGVDLFVHIQRGVLRIAQVILGIGVIDAAGEGRFITAAGPHALAFLTHNNRRAGILAGGQHAFGRDFRVAQELQRHVLIVIAGFRVEKDLRDLFLVGNAQHKRRIVEGLLCQKGEGLRVYFEDLLAFKFGHGHVLFAQQIVFSLIFC